MSRNEVALAERKRMQKVYDQTVDEYKPSFYATPRYFRLWSLLTNAYASLAHRYGEVRALERENHILVETLDRVLGDESAGRSKVRIIMLRRGGHWEHVDTLPLSMVSRIKRQEPSRWVSFGNDAFIWMPDAKPAVA